MMIGSETIFSALVTVVLFMVLISLPSVYITLTHSSVQFNKYRRLRQIADNGVAKIPPKMLQEWNTVKTDVGYIAVLTAELEKIGSLRGALFNSEISAVLILILMFVPGFELDVFILMSVLLVLCVVALFFGYMMTKLYGEEYIIIAQSLSGKGEESKDSMYV